MAQYQVFINHNLIHDMDFFVYVTGKRSEIPRHLWPRLIREKDYFRIEAKNEPEVFTIIKELRAAGVEPSEGQEKQFILEFRLNDFRKQASAITKKYQKIRKQIHGSEKFVAKLINLDDDNIFSWITPITHLNGKAVELKTSKLVDAQYYEMEIQVPDLPEWLRPDYNLKQFQEIIRTVDVKLSCDCAAFLFQGMRYQLTQLDSAIYPMNIPDPKWGPRHKHDHALCKHLLGLLNSMTVWYPAMYKLAKAKLSKYNLS